MIISPSLSNLSLSLHPSPPSPLSIPLSPVPFSMFFTHFPLSSFSLSSLSLFSLSSLSLSLLSPLLSCLPVTGSLTGKFTLSSGPSSPTAAIIQFLCDGSTLSGIAMIVLSQTSYKVSLTKNKCLAGMQWYYLLHLQYLN